MEDHGSIEVNYCTLLADDVRMPWFPMTQSRLSKRKAPLKRTLHVHDYLVSSR